MWADERSLTCATTAEGATQHLVPLGCVRACAPPQVGPIVLHAAQCMALSVLRQ